MDYTKEATAYITISENYKAAILYFENAPLSQEFLNFVKRTSWVLWKKSPSENSNKMKWHLFVDLSGTHTNEDDFEMSRANYLITKLVDEGCVLMCRHSKDEEYSSDYKKYFFGKE